jgi:integrase
MAVLDSRQWSPPLLDQTLLLHDSFCGRRRSDHRDRCNERGKGRCKFRAASSLNGSNSLGNALAACWEDIDWDMNRTSIPEPKVEHHEGRGIRSCPIFPELRPILDEAFEIFGDKSEYVVAAPQYRAAANTAMGVRTGNELKTSGRDSHLGNR